MNKGDQVYTPRFCTVRIEEVYEEAREARAAGYYEPTYYNKNPDYDILGKHTGTNRMAFAAVRK